ncbi:MFS transporter [Actinomadura kijaniata]|uniref:MFS transporter n=1 Tax=Actinomadura kijaniata TaxID=46161 RepID=UPI00082A4245|nr:aromatic acid/H+ symport family MFS transporter [Actinomadura kijaniata]
MPLRPSPARAWALPLCWAAVLLDGFDVVVLGTVLPVLLREHVWGLTPGTASVVTTVGLVGMLLGALVIGSVTDLIGRRRALMISVAMFSVFTALCAVAPSAETFGALRFLAGLGLGGCMPTALTLVGEHAADGRSGRATTMIMTGYHVGAVATALLGIVVIPDLGWKAMFVIGAAPALVLLPLMFRYLPESTSFLEGRRTEKGVAVRTLFQGGMLRATLAFWVASFMGLLLVYGLNTWLPEIMRQAGYPLGAALGLLLTLNVGAIVGLVVAGQVADRFGVRVSGIGWFAGAAVFLALLSVRLPTVGLYAAVFLAGCFVFSAQVLVYAYVVRAYPAVSRATAMGGVAGLGRIGAIVGPMVGGMLLSAGLAYPWGFYAFAVVGACGALAVVAVGRRAGRAAEAPEPVRA